MTTPSDGPLMPDPDAPAVGPMTVPAEPAAASEAEPAQSPPVASESRSLQVAKGRARPIGVVLVEAGLITEEQSQRILEHAARKRIAFGEAAVELGLLSRPQIEQVLGYQYDYPLATRGSSTALSTDVVVAFDPYDPILDELRAVRNEIQMRWLSDPELGRHRTLAVISPGENEGRSFVASNLAVTFSQAGSRTLLIDADLRSGRLHQLFGATNMGGLSTYLSGRLPAPQIHPVPGIRNLSVIASGGAPPNAGDLLARPELERLIRECEPIYDVIIVDTPAAGKWPDARIVAAACRSALVVVRQDRSPMKAVSSLVKSTAAGGVTVLGSVLLAA